MIKYCSGEEFQMAVMLLTLLFLWVSVFAKYNVGLQNKQERSGCYSYTAHHY